MGLCITEVRFSNDLFDISLACDAGPRWLQLATAGWTCGLEVEACVFDESVKMPHNHGLEEVRSSTFDIRGSSQKKGEDGGGRFQFGNLLTESHTTFFFELLAAAVVATVPALAAS